jgi:HK97 family phage portal protein
MSNFIQRIFQPQEKVEQRSMEDQFFNPVMGTLNLSSYANYSNTKAMKLAAVYRSVAVISDSIAVLPLVNYEIRNNWKYELNDDITYLLNVQPNAIMSAYIFKKRIVEDIVTKGNAFIHIIRDDDRNIKEFRILDPSFIVVLVDNIPVNMNSRLVYGIKSYQKLGTDDVYNDADIVHIMGYSTNSLVGISIIQSAAMTLGIAYTQEEQVSNSHILTGILRPVLGNNLGGDGVKAKKAKEDFIAALNTNLGGGGIVALDSGFEYQSISISPKDSQLLESREFNIINIAQFFGVPPEKLFDMSHAKAGSEESSQISFYNSTLLGYIEKIELEFFRKIYEKVLFSQRELEFDIENLMRLDSVASATYYSTMFGLGAFTTNEIREKINARNPVKGGNESFISTNLQKLSMPVVQAPAPDTNKPQENFVDNKLK